MRTNFLLPNQLKTWECDSRVGNEVAVYRACFGGVIDKMKNNQRAAESEEVMELRGELNPIAN